jgi:parallel beta-helix repeat protein
MRAVLVAVLVVGGVILATRVLAARRGCTVTVAPGDDVQEAVDRATRDAGPVTVCLGAGEFRLRRFVSIERDGVRLRGEGPSSLVRLDDGVESPLFVVGDHRTRVPARSVSNVTIERLRLVGNGGHGSELYPDHAYLTNSALVIRAGRNVTIRDVDVSRCRSACILTEHDTRDVTIERCTIAAATWDGVALNRTARLRLLGNTIRANTAAGVTAEHLVDSVVEDNTISGNGSHGVYLADSYRNTFARNRLGGNTNAGVFLTCSVRYRDPGPVLCWENSMSLANVFEANEFARNRLGYQVAADAAANCTHAGAVPNVSRGDRFVENAVIEEKPAVYGHCLLRERDTPRRRRTPYPRNASPARSRHGRHAGGSRSAPSG